MGAEENGHIIFAPAKKATKEEPKAESTKLEQKPAPTKGAKK